MLNGLGNQFVVTRLVKKLYEARRFINVFTKALHRSLS
jgi:hypothetical protein